MKMTKRAICLALAVIMALALTIPVLAADTGGNTKTITLHAGDQGTFPDGDSEYEVTATDNKLPVLPKEAIPTRTGWTFNGWYTKEITYEVQYGNPAADDYWRWVASDKNAKPISGNDIPDGVTELYAGYTPTVITIKMYPCGWKGEYAPLITHRQYGTDFDSRVFGWNTKVNEAGTDDNSRYVIDDQWSGFTYLGWFTDPGKGAGTEVTTGMHVGTGVLTGGSDRIVSVYMHWRNAAGKELQNLTDPGYKPDQGAQYVWFRDGEKKNIHLNDTVTLAVGTNPDASDPTGIEWSVDHGEIVSVTPTGTESAPTKEATIKGLQNGEAKITVKLNGISDTITVKVGHDFTIFISGYGGDCTHPGSSQWKCSIGSCDVRENRYTDVVHSYANPMTYPATCTSEGYTVRACTKCPVVEKSNIIPAKGHQFEVTTETGCSGGKVTIRTCTECGYTESDGAGDHPWAKESTIDKPPTCISTGSRSIHCTNPNCHAVKDVETIPATGKHNFPATWKTVIPAHWNQKGLEQRECPDCHTIETHVIDEVPNVPGTYPGGGGGGGSVVPEETPTPEPSPSPEVTPTPDPESTPTPAPAPVDPPKANNGTGWVYDEQTGIDYYFIDGQMKRNYWAADTSASKWNFWYYVDEEGKLVRGLQYIENPNGTGWYMLQVDDKNGCRGRLLDGVLDTGIAGKGSFVSTRGVDYGKCTWTQAWGSYNAATGLWSDGQSHR